MTFNRRIGDDFAAVREIEDRAVARSRVPGFDSSGNAAGAYTALSSGLLPANPNAPTPPFDEWDGDSGTDIDGNEFYPFILGVDTPADAGAYVMWSNARTDYGN